MPRNVKVTLTQVWNELVDAIVAGTALAQAGVFFKATDEKLPVHTHLDQYVVIDTGVMMGHQAAIQGGMIDQLIDTMNTFVVVKEATTEVAGNVPTSLQNLSTLVVATYEALNGLDPVDADGDRAFIQPMRLVTGRQMPNSSRYMIYALSWNLQFLLGNQ